MTVVVWACALIMGLAIPHALSSSEWRKTAGTMLTSVSPVGPIFSLPTDQKTKNQDSVEEDAPIVIEPPFTLLINHRKWNGRSLGWHIASGSAMWLALPGRGRYVLSLVRRTGYPFTKSGIVRKQTIVFTAGADIYEIHASKPIIARSPEEGRSLYVLHQPSWEPKGPLFGLGELEDLLQLRT